MSNAELPMHQLQQRPPTFLGLQPLDLLADVVDTDSELDIVRQRIKQKIKNQEAAMSRHIAQFLDEIHDTITRSRQQPQEYGEIIESMIQHAQDGEIEFKNDQKEYSRALKRVVKRLATVSSPRSDLGQQVATELNRLIGRYIAALQEARWMLMAALAEIERDESAPVASTPEELIALLRRPE